MTSLMLFPLLFQTQRGTGANLNELMKWFKFSDQAAKWRTASCASSIESPYTYGVPMSRAINALVGDGVNTKSPKGLFDQISIEDQRPVTQEGSFVIAFNASDEAPKRTANLSAPLRDAFHDAHQLNELNPPLYLATGEGWKSICAINHSPEDSINMAINLAREANSLAMITLIRLHRAVAGAVKDSDSESTISSEALYFQFFCHMKISFVNQGDDPASVDFYIFADKGTIEETVEAFESVVFAALSNEKISADQRAMVEGNFFRQLWNIPVATQ